MPLHTYNLLATALCNFLPLRSPAPRMFLFPPILRLCLFFCPCLSFNLRFPFGSPLRRVASRRYVSYEKANEICYNCRCNVLTINSKGFCSRCNFGTWWNEIFRVIFCFYVACTVVECEEECLWKINKYYSQNIFMLNYRRYVSNYIIYIFVEARGASVHVTHTLFICFFYSQTKDHRPRSSITTSTNAYSAAY